MAKNEEQKMAGNEEKKYGKIANNTKKKFMEKIGKILRNDEKMKEKNGGTRLRKKYHKKN